MTNDPRKLWEFQPDNKEFGRRTIINFGLILLCPMGVMITTLLLMRYGKSVDTLAEFYQSKFMSFVLHNELAIAVGCFVVVVVGCYKMARK